VTLRTGSVFDSQVYDGLSQGQRTVEELNKKTNIEQFEDLREKIEDQMADQAEKQQFFEGIGQEDQDDLLDELDELEAELAQEDFDQMEVPAGQVDVGQQEMKAPQKQPAAKAKDEAAELEAMMS